MTYEMFFKELRKLRGRFVIHPHHCTHPRWFPIRTKRLSKGFYLCPIEAVARAKRLGPVSRYYAEAGLALGLKEHQIQRLAYAADFSKRSVFRARMLKVLGLKERKVTR